MIKMVMPRSLRILADKGIRGIAYPATDRYIIAILGYEIKACPVLPCLNSGMTGGRDEQI